MTDHEAAYILQRAMNEMNDYGSEGVELFVNALDHAIEVLLSRKNPV